MTTLREALRDEARAWARALAGPVFRLWARRGDADAPRVLAASAVTLAGLAPFAAGSWWLFVASPAPPPLWAVLAVVAPAACWEVFWAGVLQRLLRGRGR